MEVPLSGRIIPIIAEDIRSEAVPLAEFYVARFEDKKKIGPFLKKVPLSHEEFDHLKRVDKQGRVLIQSAQKPLSSVVLEVLKELEMADSDAQAVPASRPLTSRQFDWAKQYWPTAFHPDKETESLLNGTFLSSDEKELVHYWSGQALRVGCIVVQNNEELTRGSRTERLLGHPVICMVQNLAKCNRSNDDYLATGCDVYLKDEPCAMCAMVRDFLSKISGYG
ncbi:unnamed protein product [Heligmosomoides polygyrus]|uniref:CMP/dCMP-type deaminase domain-containing protein n=1 Tax=Heligmosomoides polygyrus TaxID=6339 RepID=A0A183G4P1_HELPZ|nr:unnamed protein product [Heligmosomoides polygyrus]